MNHPRYSLLKSAALVTQVAAVVMTFACQRDPLAPAVPGPELAEVSLALAGVPADVACVSINVAYQQSAQQRRFPVAGDGVFVLPRLPVGLVVFSVEAFASACNTLATGDVPTWFGGPVSVTLQPGLNAPVKIDMRPNGQTSVVVGFDGGAPAPMCAALGSACGKDGDCCSSRCVVDLASANGIGSCQAPPVVSDAGAAPDVTPMTPVDTAPAPKTVTVRLDGEGSYLLYAIDKGTGCKDGSPSTYLAKTFDKPLCVSPEVGDVYPVLLGAAQVCTAGQGCVACTTPSCLPEGCFKEAPASTTGACKVTLGVKPGQITRFILFKKPTENDDPDKRPSGLPRVINNAGDGPFDLVVTPDAAHQSFAVVRLGAPVIPAEEQPDSCGGASLCGIVPFQGWSSGFFGNWSFGGGAFNLLTAPLF